MGFNSKFLSYPRIFKNLRLHYNANVVDELCSGGWHWHCYWPGRLGSNSLQRSTCWSSRESLSPEYGLNAEDFLLSRNQIGVSMNNNYELWLGYNWPITGHETFWFSTFPVSTAPQCSSNLDKEKSI